MSRNSAVFPSSLMLALAVVVGGCASSPSPQEEIGVQPAGIVTTEVAVPVELFTVRPAYIQAWSSTDPLAFNTYFSENAVVITPTERFTGLNDIRTRWIGPMLTGTSNFTIMPSSFTREGNDIIEGGRYSYRVTHEGGHTEVKNLGYSYRWQKQADGTWRIVGVSVQ